LNISGYSLEKPWMNNITDISSIYEGTYPMRIKNRWRIWIDNVPGRTVVQMHSGLTIKDTSGCIIGLENINMNKEEAIGGWDSTHRIMERITSGMETEKMRDPNSNFRVHIMNISFPYLKRMIGDTMRKIAPWYFGKEVK
jgi:hypothetical protein